MVVCRTKSCIPKRGFLTQTKRPSVMFAIAVVSLTGVLGQRLYSQPQLKEGQIAQETIRAAKKSEVENKVKTQALREEASRGSIPVLMVDGQINDQVQQDLQKFLDKGNEIRSIMGEFPFSEPSTLSVSTQLYLRSMNNGEWQSLLLALARTKSGLASVGVRNSAKSENPVQKPKSIVTAFSTTPSSSDSTIELQTPDLSSTDFSQNAEFTQAMAELETYALKNSYEQLSSLIVKIDKARQGYTRAKAKFSRSDENLEAVFDEKTLLQLSDKDWKEMQVGIRESAGRILTQGIPPGLPDNIKQDAVNRQVKTLVPKDAELLATMLLLKVLQPNLKTDREQTRIKEELAAAKIKPVMVKIPAGKVIVRKGQKITAWDLAVLEHYHLIRRGINWVGIGKLAGIVTLCVSIYAVIEWRSHSHLRQRDRLLVLLLNLSTPLILTIGLPYTTWSALGILLGSFYGATLGLTSMGLLVVLLPMSLEISKIALFAGAAGGILGSSFAKRLRSREEQALLGLAIAFTQFGVFLFLSVISGAAFGRGLYILLQQAALFGLSGLAWSIVALGLSPYLEKFFDLVTPIRLAELANPNRPLLKTLATEAPGTFQHTLFVATLAEAAAKKLGCNVELVRAGTLYHDIGKTHDPLSFIENQMGGPNKHETEIKDPWKSAEIIKKHVSEGLLMARKHRLPTAIQAFIPEHQGTMQIAYFYHQAVQMAQQDESIKVDEADFRYDGPIPQSKETAIVMLADSCEAALRSLKDANPEQALKVVNNILRARWQDNQMVDSGLTRDNMTELAEIFVEVWQQFHHKRIAYPKVKS